MARTYTYQETITLRELECASCGIMFAVPQKWLAEKERRTTGFYCPNGHGLTYGSSEESHLRQQLQSEQKRIRELELQLTSANDQLQATKRELQQQKKRVANGVCPCCNRSFVKLQQHMKTKHPEYASHE
jgi:septal ring factor EnvC (AmiA/AmiB activator)